MAWRCDTAEIGRVERTPAGGLRAPATVARAGVLVYPWGREYVPPETLRASLPQLGSSLPITLRHPPSRRVDSANWSRESVGNAADDAQIEGDAQSVTLNIQRADAVKAVEDGGYRQLSMGYDVELDPTPGTAPDGQPYDARQTARTYNHIALVREARGGSTLALRLDEVGDAMIDEPASAGEETYAMKKKVRLDGIDFEVEAPESYFQALEQAEARRADELKAEKARADSVTGERDTLKGQLDETKKRLDEASDPARLDERVKARAELETAARKILGDGADLAGKTDREVMEMAVRTDEKDDLSARSDDYIRGAFEARCSAPGPRREDGLDRARRAVTMPPREERQSPMKAAISRLRQDQAEAATRPLGGTR